MDITFDTIINILSNKKDNFINKINIVKPIDKFNFDLPIFRIGVLNSNSKKMNISLFQSILYLVNTEYIFQTPENKINMMIKLINDIRNYWKLNYNSENNISLLDGEKIISNLPKINTEKFNETLFLLSFCLKSNFLVLDYNTEKSKIISYYLNDSNLNFYKPFIILAKKDNNIEPVFNNEKRIFNYEDIINYLTGYNSIEIEDIFEEKSVFINKSALDFSEGKLKRLKKKELQDLCDTRNISYINKDTKSVLINKLIN